MNHRTDNSLIHLFLVLCIWLGQALDRNIDTSVHSSHINGMHLLLAELNNCNKPANRRQQNSVQLFNEHNDFLCTIDSFICSLSEYFVAFCTLFDVH